MLADFDMWLDDFKAHVLKDYPNEAVGIVVDEQYIPIPNRSDNPTQQFSIPSSIFYKYQPSLILHSHTTTTEHNQSWASSHDMRLMIQYPNIQWGIISTDGINTGELIIYDDTYIPELLGRPFVHGLYDCYGMVRDYFRLDGYNIKNYPRSYKWWENGQNLYIDNFKDAGFIEVDNDDLQTGDVLLMAVTSETIHHAAIYVGNNTIYHHLINRLSRADRLDQWHKYTKLIVRNTNEKTM